MADPSKTEAATPKRRREARERGQIARSQEVNSFLIMLAMLIALRYTAQNILLSFETISKHYLGHLGAFPWTLQLIMSNLSFFVLQMLNILLPIFVATIIAALVAGFGQAGFMVTFAPLGLKLSKLNPLNGLQRIFSKQGLAELLRSTLKIILVGYVAYATVKGRFMQLFLLGGMDLKQGLLLVSDVVYQLIFRILIVLALIAGLDFLFQRNQFEENLRMTREEVRDELKQVEGDPRTRSRIRTRQRQMAMRRMMQAVPQAVVVVTNPVHLAVALEYDEKMPAPRVAAKGAGFIAEKIKEIAKENKIPIVEKPPLAQSLFKSVEIGKFIPPALYRTVAEIIAYVYQLKMISNRGARNVAE